MEVPKDYVLSIMKQALDDKINATEHNIRSEMREIRSDIKDLKMESKSFYNVCKISMESHDKRIRSNEDFKLKLIATAGAVGTISALIFSIFIKILS